jgi:AcrR family transcriptional regulator
MPKGFTGREKELIRARLIERGRECLATYGIRRTSVEDLTGAAGISKGAFYLFFDSKEELFFEIISQFEDEYHAALLGERPQVGEPHRAFVRRFLSKAFSLWRSSLLFTHFDRAEYEHLLRKLPEEQIRAGLRSDETFIVELLAQWRAAGLIVGHDPRLVVNLMRALFVVQVHASDFDQERYPALIDLLIDLVAGYLTEQQ